jgi:hypothetical protein
MSEYWNAELHASGYITFSNGLTAVPDTASYKSSHAYQSRTGILVADRLTKNTDDLGELYQAHIKRDVKYTFGPDDRGTVWTAPLWVSPVTNDDAMVVKVHDTSENGRFPGRVSFYFPHESCEHLYVDQTLVTGGLWINGGKEMSQAGSRVLAWGQAYAYWDDYPWRMGSDGSISPYNDSTLVLGWGKMLQPDQSAVAGYYESSDTVVLQPRSCESCVRIKFQQLDRDAETLCPGGLDPSLSSMEAYHRIVTTTPPPVIGSSGYSSSYSDTTTPPPWTCRARGYQAATCECDP